MGLRYDAILGRVRETDENGGGGGVQSPAPIVASTAPTTATAGAVGQLYVDTATSKTYHCTAVTVDDTDPQNPVTTYEWTDDINAKGGLFVTNDGIKIVSVATANIGATYTTIKGAGNIQGGYGCVTGGNYGAVALGYYAEARGSIASFSFGQYTFSGDSRQLVHGYYNVKVFASRAVGQGTGENARRNIEELSRNGDHYISGGHQQGITLIPASTSAYTLAEGGFEHIPSSAPTYTLPDVYKMIVADATLWTRSPENDGTGYYAWIIGSTKRYTASATPAVGDNTYTNTALTSGAKAITAIDRRTHECILTVRFSASALSVAFQDAAGNPITPLPLAGTIVDGSVVCYRCTWEELLGRWVIMPVMLGTYSAGV